MDCCNYGEYRPGPYGGARAWDTYATYGALPTTPAPPPMPYAPYAQRGYYAHEPYARYGNRYEYPSYPMQHPREHAMPMEYVSSGGGGGAGYATKETRGRRSATRRDGRARTPVHHLPVPHTPPLEFGFSRQGPSYYEQPTWHNYQIGAMNGGNGWSSAGMYHNTTAWSPRPMACRDQMRYANDYRSLKGYPQANQLFSPDGRSTPYSLYDDAHYSMENGCMPRAGTADSSSVSVPSPPEMQEPPPREKPPEQPPKQQVNIVPLPAFQQAFGSTEIGKFSEAFSRTELVIEEMSNVSFSYDSYHDWDTASENQWTSQNASREIKCEDTF